MKLILVTLLFLSGARASALFGVQATVAADTVTGNTSDFHLFDSGGFLQQFMLTSTQNATSSDHSPSVTLSAIANAGGTAYQGLLQGSLSAGVAQNGPGNFGATASAPSSLPRVVTLTRS